MRRVGARAYGIDDNLVLITKAIAGAPDQFGKGVLLAQLAFPGHPGPVLGYGRHDHIRYLVMTRMHKSKLTVELTRGEGWTCCISSGEPRRLRSPRRLSMIVPSSWENRVHSLVASTNLVGGAGHQATPNL